MILNTDALNTESINTVSGGEISFRLRQPWREYIEWRLRQPWNGILGWQIRQPWSHTIIFRARQPWAEFAVALALYRSRQPWTERGYDALTMQFAQPWREIIDVRFRQIWRERHVATLSRHRQAWTARDYDALTFRLRQPWREYIEWRLRQPISQAHEINRQFRCRQPWLERSYDALAWRIRQPWVEISDAYQVFTGSAYVTIDGRRVELAEASISADENSPYWHAELTLFRLSDYARFTRDSPFTLHFYGTNYALIVDTRALSRAISETGQPQRSATVGALSPLALTAGPRAQTLNRLWDRATLAQTLVEELIGAVTWETANWAIPANRFGVNGLAPLDAARQVVDAVGAMILSDPDGSPIVRPAYPVSIPLYDPGLAAIVLTAETIYGAEESISLRQSWNRIAIRNSEDIAYQDRIEFVADLSNGLKGMLHAYPSPWSSTVMLSTTRNGVSLSRVGATARDETETVEIVEGRGSVRYPVHTIRSIEYLDKNLGGVGFAGTDITTAEAGYSLMKITYRTRYVAYGAKTTSDREAQILLERL